MLDKQMSPKDPANWLWLIIPSTRNFPVLTI